MNILKIFWTLQNCQPANFVDSSELVHTFIDFSQPPDKLELLFIEFFFTLVESKIFKNGKEETDDWQLELNKSSRTKRPTEMIDKKGQSEFGLTIR